jgi:hypothetical protein
LSCTPWGRLTGIDYSETLTFNIGAGNEMRYRQPRCRVPLGVALTVYLNLEFYFDFIIGAGNEIRTRDPNLGKVVLYH